MREMDLVFRTMFAELAQQSLDAQFHADFPLEGRFVTVPVKGKDYFYFDIPTPEGKDKRSYVGPAADPEIAARVQRHRDIKDNMRERRRLVSTLIRSGGMSGPDRFAGDVTKALADAGFFRLRGVLVGSVAYGCYSGVLGVRLPTTAMQTGDADLAMDFAISQEVDDSLPPILDILHGVDPSFGAVPHQADKARVTAFVNRNNYRVEFLTSNRGSDEYTGRPSPMPALGGASAESLRFLDYLIYEPVRTVLLHREGVSVNVPAPERYAVHKLIVASRRLTDALGRAKRAKDLLQAATLFEAMLQTRQGVALADAYQEAWDRGPSWQEGLAAGLALMPDDGKEALADALGVKPEELGKD
ncbi:nucleotidyltransferase family protein [Sinorhizobium meliloti]|uniref:Nucleotidyltransferase-like domain-containing protein n=1 Tax=Rhizobium meliloti TaxID=382 RepID=A0A2J0YTU7_RHIML|nr:GSU2403 family nucleotidyltransferase fold protein [Sinorhizobium meliloti]PJR09719.1 hypothetical protein CEJ86_30875 [Sinorhizobium meliloti]